MSDEDRLRSLLGGIDRSGRPDLPEPAAFVAGARRRLRRRRAFMSVAVVAVLVAGIGAVATLGIEERVPPVRPGPIPTPDLGRGDERPRGPGCGAEPSPRPASPLGWVAYARGPDLFVADLEPAWESPADRGHSEMLVEGAGEPSAATPVRASPSGSWVAFGEGELVPATSGQRCLPLGESLFRLKWSPHEDSFVALTEDGALVLGMPSGRSWELLPPGSSPQGFAFHPSGLQLAADQEDEDGRRIVTIDLRTYERRQLLPTPPEGLPHVAAWSADGEWVLYWQRSGSASVDADGGPLLAVPAEGREPVTVIEEMLFAPDFLTWCEETLVVAAGGGRYVTENKRLVAVAPPEWDPSEVPQRDGSVFWPDCSVDGSVAATVTEDQAETRFGTAHRQIMFGYGLDDPSIGGFGVPRLASEFPRWSRNHPGQVTILFVGRERTPTGHAAVYLQGGERTVFVGDLGQVSSYYGLYGYDSLFDWYQP